LFLDKTGNILIDNWKPTSLTEEVCDRLKSLPSTISKTLEIDENWGEPGLSSNEKLFGAVETLVAMLSYEENIDGNLRESLVQLEILIGKRLVGVDGRVG